MERDDVMRATVRHTKRVGELMTEMVTNLMRRAVLHDESKFSTEEFDMFSKETGTLAGLTYGSPEYNAALDRMPNLKFHYQRNSHHPQHYRCGKCPQCQANDWDAECIGSTCYECGGGPIEESYSFQRMCLLDLVEMLADWKAATERHDNGDLKRSIEINAGRFGYDDAMKKHLLFTAQRLGWCD